MEWAFLVIAGGLEVFWSTCMKYSNGFTEIKYTILTIVGIVLFKEPVTAARIFFVSLLLVGIVGLKATSGH